MWALTSKVQGTFEFDVQPLREYFTARYLYDFAGADQRGFDMADVLCELVRRGYWRNTSGFFAGFAKPNELAGLVETLEEERDEGTRPRQLCLPPGSCWPTASSVAAPAHSGAPPNCSSTTSASGSSTTN